MKKVTNILCILFAFLSLAILVYARKDQPFSVPTVTQTVTVEVTVTPEIVPVESAEPEYVPEPESFLFSFVGDCVLASSKGGTSYNNTINGDYSYPFRNVVKYTGTDEFTVANLECAVSDTNLADNGNTFTFLAPSANLFILKAGSVDFVNTANNHSGDYGQAGLESTYSALEASGLYYGKAGETCICETENGLKIGLYCEPFNAVGKKTDQIAESVKAGVKELQQQNVDIIIVLFHFGQELHYTVDESESIPARAAIDAGATIVYGCHTHVLQPVEEYGDGIIMYSLGNFTYGGSTMPTDPDTAVIQVELMRDIDGTVSYQGYSAIPCCVSSTFPDDFNNIRLAYNDYCPLPYEKGSDHYERVISKLTGTADTKDRDPDYSAFHTDSGEG